MLRHFNPANDRWPARRYDRAADVRLLLPLVLPRNGKTAFFLGKSYSITSSARPSSVGATSRPSARAVLRLITSSTEKFAPPHAVPPRHTDSARTVVSRRPNSRTAVLAGIARVQVGRLALSRSAMVAARASATILALRVASTISRRWCRKAALAGQGRATGG